MAISETMQNMEASKSQQHNNSWAAMKLWSKQKTHL